MIDAGVEGPLDEVLGLVRRVVGEVDRPFADYREGPPDEQPDPRNVIIP